MAFNLEVAKKVDHKTRDIINGYIRNAQKLLPENSFYNISSLIQTIIMIYCYNPEYFTIHGKGLKLNENKDTIQFMEQYMTLNAYTAYGNIAINKYDQGIFIWKFKIVKPLRVAIIAIGIDSSQKKHPNLHFAHADTPCYGYQSYGNTSREPPTGLRLCTVLDDNNDTNYGCIYSNDRDEIIMEFDMNDKTLRYLVNGKDQGIAFNNITFDNNEEYTMCVSLDDDMIIQLTEFQHVFE